MNTVKKILGLIVAFGIFVFGGWYIIKDDQKNPPVNDGNKTSGTTSGTTPSSSSGASAGNTSAGTTGAATASKGYKDGSYTATGQYDSPAGLERVTVSLALKDNTIVSAEVTANSANRRSQKYQKDFIGGFKPYVIGKKIDSVNLDVVSGSSLTPEGFNDALNTIKQQAQA